MAFNTGAIGQVQAQPAQADPQVQSPPSDTVSSLNFTPVASANLLAASAWSGQVLVWDTVIGQNGQPASQPKAEQRHELAMDSAWFPDGAKIATCGGDRTVKVWDLASNKQMQIGQHDAPVRAVCTLHPQAAAGKDVVVSGGWDKKVRYWDLRENKMIGEIAVDEKVYAMDYRDHTLVVATAEEPISAAQGCNVTQGSASTKQNGDRCRKVYVIDIRNPGAVKSKDLSPLAYQTRCIAAFPGDAGYLIGSIEGRVGVTNFPGTHPKSQTSYTFKCHRITRDAQLNVTSAPNTKPATTSGSYASRAQPKEEKFDEVHAVNDICFHPLGTFLTVGSDGCFITWDKDEKSRLQKPNNPLPLPITAASFNGSGSMLAYATGYDWAQGHEYYDPSNAAFRPQIYLHKLEKSEVDRRSNRK